MPRIKFDPIDPLTWECLPPISKEPISGVYVIFVASFDEYMDKSRGKLVYIGESINIIQRIDGHTIYKQLDQFYPDRYLTTIMYLETAYHKIFERFLIQMYRPQFNIKHNGLRSTI